MAIGILLLISPVSRQNLGPCVQVYILKIKHQHSYASLSLSHRYTHTPLQNFSLTLIYPTVTHLQDLFYTSSFQLFTYLPHFSDSDRSVTLFYISWNASLGPLLLSLMPCAAMQRPLLSHVACCHHCASLYVDSSSFL